MRRKKILVTGITGGLGTLIASKLAPHCDLYGTTTQKEKINERIFYLDYTKKEKKISLLLFEIPWDGVVLNAGIGIIGDPLEFEDQEMEKIFRINVMGPLMMLKKLKKSPKKLVFISSKCIFHDRPGLKIYSSTKQILGEILEDLYGEKLIIFYPDSMKTDMKIQFCKHMQKKVWRPIETDWEDPREYVNKIYDFLL